MRCEICNATLMTRFAIEGGLDSETTYNTSDLYIYNMNKCRTVEEVLDLHYEMVTFFTEKMQKLDKESVFTSSMPTIFITLDKLNKKKDNENICCVDLARSLRNTNFIDRIQLQMKRGVFMDHFMMLREISDGNLYGVRDTVKADTGGCRDCSRCCEDMCDTISLDPYDIYSLCKGLGKDYNSLMEEEFIVTGLHNLVSMPHINNRGSGCGFLNEKKRCTVHDFRPGICRLFPMGRYYHDDTVSYILQTHGCTKEERGEVRVCDWLEITDIDAYEEYVLKWHKIVKKISDFMKEPAMPGVKKKIHERFLKHFYETPYDLSQEFYPQIYERIRKWNESEQEVLEHK